MMTENWIWELPALASSILVGIGSIGTLFYHRSAIARAVRSWRILRSVQGVKTSIYVVTSEEGWEEVMPLLYRLRLPEVTPQVKSHLWRGCYHRQLTKEYNSLVKELLLLQRSPSVPATDGSAAFVLEKREAKREGAVGFDCEWVQVKGHRRPVALLQLASCSGVCVLLRLSHMKSHFPHSLRGFLEDETILKVGVGPLEDSNNLAADYGLKVKGCVDLRYLALQCQSCESSHSSKTESDRKTAGNMGLNALAQKYLGRTLDKDWRVRAGDWEADILTKRQVRYAAEDAVVGIHILMTLMEKLWVCSPILPFLPWAAWQRHLAKAVHQTCHGLLDVRFLFCNKQQDAGMKLNTQSYLPAKLKISTRGNCLRKGPLYYNCQLKAPDNQPLCTIDPKKAWWYVEKGLGELISEDPVVVRLKFEPSGRPQAEKDDGRFYLQARDNVCVVCGKDETYIRKNIVPHEYRKYFPDLLKHHQNHDVVLLCLTCHRQSNILDNIMRSQLAKEFDAPTSKELDFKTTICGTRKNVRNAARALLNHHDNIPEKKVAGLETLIKDFFKVEEILPEHLQNAANMRVKFLHEGFQIHGQKVYEAYKKVGLVKLEQRWRQHFLDTMKPQYMPECWSVNHNVYKMQLKIGRLPLDHPNRQIYKIALVGTEGTIDIPYAPKLGRESNPPDTSTAPSRDLNPDYTVPSLPISADKDNVFENTSASANHATLKKDVKENCGSPSSQKGSNEVMINDENKKIRDDTCSECTSKHQEGNENNGTHEANGDSSESEMEEMMSE